CLHAWNAEAAYAGVLAEELRAGGHAVTVVTNPGSPNEAELRRREFEIVPASLPAGANPLRWSHAVRALSALQTQRRIEIVDVFRSSELPFHLAAASPAVRVVRTRGIDRPIRANWINRKMHRDGCAGLIASADVVGAQMERQLGIPQGNIRTIYYPIDLPPLPTAEERREGKRRFLAEIGADGDRLLIGVVGRLAQEKGHRLLIEAMGRLVRRIPCAHLAILARGRPADDPEHARLVAQVQAAGLTPFVRFLGFREDVRQVMGWMDLGVVSSLASEMNCRVAVEFLSVGTPVVALPTGALPEVVEHDLSGLVTDSHSAEALAVALERLAGDPALRLRLARGARRQAEQRFSRAGFLAATLEVFEAALAGRRASG
ncbi:MAG: glycosyltransferase family 4 protein, partial [SAR324 cluster bacterium]|nr:glycosyltransferase family 4 protein [SAR324 cluster bacterium]